MRVRKMHFSLSLPLQYAAFILLLLALALGLYGLITFLRESKNVFRQSVSGEPTVRYTLVIDAGHGGEDGGASGTADGKTVIEKELNLAIARDLSDLLALNGYNVVLTREEDILLYDRNSDYQGRKKRLDLAARVAIAERVEHPLFISIHMNTFPDTGQSGTQIWFSPNNENSALFAQTVRESITARLQPANTRACLAAGSSIYILEQLQCPAILVECGFLSNPDECAQLCQIAYRQKLTLILYEGIRTFLETLNSTPSGQENTQKNLILPPVRAIIKAEKKKGR